MRFVALFKKTMIENLRDWKILILGLTFAPFFVVLMYLYFDYGAQVYRVIVVNRDAGALGREVIAQVMEIRSSDGSELLRVREEDDLETALARLQDGAADFAVEIPETFSAALSEYVGGAASTRVTIKSYGNPANPKYMMAAAFWDYTMYEHVGVVTGEQGPLRLEANSVGNIASPDEFELYVPGLLALSFMMLMFTAAASLIREKDKGTLIRLRISRMTTFEWLAAISATQVVIGLAALGLTYLTAAVLGYRSSGSIVALLVVAFLSSMAIVGVSVVVAASMRTIFDLLTIGSFPFFILMFFSGGMFPLPDVRLFTLGDRGVNINDVLPTTHTITALDRILNYGGGLGDVAFELVAITALTVAFFGFGTWWFRARHMRAA
jgi:ABC-2 type transport system permease protein